MRPYFSSLRPYRAHRALVRGGELLQRAPRVERGEQLAVLVLRPRLAGLRRQLRLAPLEALDALERARRLVAARAPPAAAGRRSPAETLPRSRDRRRSPATSRRPMLVPDPFRSPPLYATMRMRKNARVAGDAFTRRRRFGSDDKSCRWRSRVPAESARASPALRASSRASYTLFLQDLSGAFRLVGGGDASSTISSGTPFALQVLADLRGAVLARRGRARASSAKRWLERSFLLQPHPTDLQGVAAILRNGASLRCSSARECSRRASVA